MDYTPNYPSDFTIWLQCVPTDEIETIIGKEAMGKLWSLYQEELKQED